MALTEPLTVAQVLADLMDFQNADPKAAKELLVTNKTLYSSESSRRKSAVDNRLRQQSFGSSRRRSIIETVSVPSLTATTSTMSGISLPGTPSEEGDDEDMMRAKELISLYAKRDKFKKLGDTGMGRAKEMVDEVVARYQ